MPDITMCKNYNCPAQDTCWRLNAPPNKFRQSYASFSFDEDGFEEHGDFKKSCGFYIDSEQKWD